MTIKEYYTAPPQEIFDEIKAAAMEVWLGYDDTYGYASGKIERIKDLENIQDNAWYMVAMFDPPNQRLLLSKVSLETRTIILCAMQSE